MPESWTEFASGQRPAAASPAPMPVPVPTCLQDILDERMALAAASEGDPPTAEVSLVAVTPLPLSLAEVALLRGNGTVSSPAKLGADFSEFIHVEQTASRPARGALQEPTDYPTFEQRFRAGRALQRLAWSAAHTFEKGLEETVRWYVDNAAW